MKPQAKVELREIQDCVEEFEHGCIPTKRFEIVRKSDGKVVGNITLRHTNNEYLTLYRGHTGFKIDEEFRRCGYACAALGEVIDIARVLGMPRIVATCRHDNMASERTILRAGLSYEATVDVPEYTYLWNHGIKKVKRFSKELQDEG